MMSRILHGLCNGNPFWKNNVRSDCRPGLEISFITFCAFQCQGTSILGQCIHLLSPSLSLCWNSFPVIFNGYLKDLQSNQFDSGLVSFPRKQHQCLSVDTRGKFFTVRTTSNWDNLPRKVVDSPALNTFKMQLHRVLGHLV